MPPVGCHGSQIRTIIGLRDVSLPCAHLSRLRSQGGLGAWLNIDLLGKAFEMARISKSTQMLCELWEGMHAHMQTYAHADSYCIPPVYIRYWGRWEI